MNHVKLPPPPLSLSYVPAQHILVMFDYTLRQHLNMAFTLLNEEAILADFLDIEIFKSHFFFVFKEIKF